MRYRYENEEIFLPEGDYRKRKDFQFCLFFSESVKYFSRKYLTISFFTLLRRRLLKENNDGISSFADLLVNSRELTKEEKRIFSEKSQNCFREMQNIFEMYLKMKKQRIFPLNDPLMCRFRSFHIRSFEEFRSWISIERYDSDFLYDETLPAKRQELVLYPSSAELAANGLSYMAKVSAHIVQHTGRKL